MAEATMETLAARIAVLEQERAAAQAAEPEVSRRHLLRGVGAAIAGAAGASVLNAAPAAAATGTWSYGTNTRVDAGTDGSGLKSSNDSKTLVVENYGSGQAIVADTRNGTADAIQGLAASDGVAGVKGVTTAPTGVGVRGVAEGSSINSTGVRGVSTNGIGGSFDGGGIGVIAFGAIPLILVGGATAGPPALNGNEFVGALYADRFGVLYNFVGAGPFGNWIRVGLNPVRPFRLADTRTTTPVAAGIANQRSFTVAPSGSSPDAVPSIASAACLNVTVVNPTASGYVTVLPSDQTFPGPDAPVSNVNFVAGQTQANQVTLKLGPDGKVKVFNRSGTVDVIIDVLGFYV
jgi:hypothetical protein